MPLHSSHANEQCLCMAVWSMIPLRIVASSRIVQWNEVGQVKLFHKVQVIQLFVISERSVNSIHSLIAKQSSQCRIVFFGNFKKETDNRQLMDILAIILQCIHLIASAKLTQCETQISMSTRIVNKMNFQRICFAIDQMF